MKKLFAIASIVGLVTFNVPIAAFAAAATITSVTVGAQTGTLTAGTSGSATYLVTVVRSGNGNDTANLSVSAGLPANVTASFSPTSLSYSGNNATSTATLTLTTTSTTTAQVATSFTVTSNSVSGNGSLTVNPTPLTPQTITVSTNAPANAEYNATFPVAATADSGLTVAITTTGACSIASGVVTMTAGTGICTVHYNQAGDSTYAAAPEVLEMTTATTKSLTASVTANSKAYDTTNAATISNCSLSGIVGSDNVTCSSASATFADATVGTGKEVTATGIALGGAGAANYSLSATTATTTADITKATLIYNADVKSRAYGDVDPVFTGTVTGLAGSEVLTDVTTGTATFGTTATVSSNVGTYPINGSGLTVTSPNYETVVAQAAGNATALTITKAFATMLISNTTQVFNGTPKTVTAVTTPSGLAVDFTYNGSATAPTAVGSYAVVGTINETNYQGTDNTTLAITNNTPTANAASTSTLEDTPKVITLSGDDGETVPTQTLTYTLATLASNGVVNIVGNQATYTPNANWNGTDSFTFTVNDGDMTSAPATVDITVTPVNDTPSFTKGADVTLPQDSGAHTVINWVVATSTGPSDEASQTLNYIVSNNFNALFSVQPSISPLGELTFTSGPNATGTAVVSVQIQDDGGTVNGGIDTSAIQTFNIVITKVNVAPVASNQTVSTNEDTAATVTMVATDANTDAVTYSIVSGPTNGTLGSISGNQVTYTPNANWNGTDTFTFKATDVDSADSNVATVTVTVSAVNDTPSFSVGANQMISEDAGAQTISSFATSLSTGPSDENGQTLDFIVSNDNNVLFSVQPSISATGELTYTPAANANGFAVVSVQIHDNGGTANGGSDTSAIQTFSIIVNAVNDDPVLATITDPTGDELTAITFTASATDVDAGTTLSYSLVGEPSGASINSSTGEFSWTPTEAQGGYGPYTFDVVVSNGNGGTDSQTITVTVNEVNEVPTVNPLSVITDEDTPVSDTVTGSDVDDPVQTLTYAVATAPANGTLTSFDASTGAFTYESALNYYGADSFTFTANDGVATSAPATVSITVTSVNDLPVMTILGSDPTLLSHEYVGFVDPKASAIDVEDGDISASVTPSMMIDTSNIGTYTVTYSVTDSNGGSSSIDRVVTIVPRLGGGGSGSGEVGCRDPKATNYSATAAYDGGTCTYPQVLGASTTTESFSSSTPMFIVTVSTSTPNGQVLGAVMYTFTRNLTLGSRGEDVGELQKILIAGGFLNIATPTNYFGQLTRTAVAKWQAKNGLPATGYFGPLSRAFLAK